MKLDLILTKRETEINLIYNRKANRRDIIEQSVHLKIQTNTIDYDNKTTTLYRNLLKVGRKYVGNLISWKMFD